MAQQGQGPGAGGIQESPRTNKTIKDFVGQNTQNERNALDEGSFHWLENIQPIGKGNLHSIPGRSLSKGLIPPTPPPLGCNDLTERGQQVITIQDYFINQFAPDPGNTRTSWGFIGTNEEVYTLVGQGACGGGNMNYDNTCCQINHFIGPGTPVGTLVLPVTIPSFTFVNTRPGSADVISWAATSNGIPGGGNGLGAFFDIGLTQASYNLEPLFPDEFSQPVNAWALAGNEMWTAHYDTTTNVQHLVVFTKNGATVLHDYTPFAANIQTFNIQLDATYCYCLISDGTNVKIARVNRSDGSLASTFDLTSIAAQFVSIANDNLIYVLCSGSPAKVYYVKNFTDLIYVGKTAGSTGFSPLSYGTGVWKNGAIYFGSSGFGGSNPDIFKIAIPCPPGVPPAAPIIASVSTGSTVVAGSSINVTWSNILTPDSFDWIQLAPAPAAGHLGFNGATATHQTTGAIGSGTLSFTIPGPTTPGTYVFQLTTESGTVLIATSNTFTVT